MLDDLVAVIETLKKRIAKHGASLRENETRTRMALIDPLLTALGWDVADPAKVTPEYTVSGGRADYALLEPKLELDLVDKPAATVEAKKLGESLDSHRMQMLTYSNASGIAFAGLTDGNHWQLYRTFEPVPLEQKLVLDVFIANTPAHEAALKLLLLWRPNLVSGQPVVANEPIVAATMQPAQARPSHTVNAPVGLNQILPLDDSWRDLKDINYQKGDKKPTGIRFSSGETKNLKSWADAWFEVCEWLAVSGRLISEDCPVPSPRGSGVRVIVNTIPKHPRSNKNPDGSDFAQSRSISTGLFIETNYKPRDLIHNSIFLLERQGISPDTVELRFE